jgi:radical SAM superfamily enzyme YgiQ (UPF0313 family)
LWLGAVLEGREDYRIVDGNLEADPPAELEAIDRESPIELLGVSVMPGPQMAAAIPICREFRRRHPETPIVWGGYFPSIYPDATLNAEYVDFAVRGQGQKTFLELLDAVRGGASFEGIRGLSWKSPGGGAVHNLERAFEPPDAFPEPPYHRIAAERYVLPTFLGRRTAVHEASVGCPYACNFCGVVTAYGSREKQEAPARSEAILRGLQGDFAIDAVQFYDNNFFLGEAHAAELMERMTPLGLNWWCEARVDAVLRFSDATLRKIRDAGARMIFFGAESGSDWVLEQMNKKLRAEQTLELAARIRQFGITPELSFVVGNPQDPARDIEENLAFIRKIKRLNPDAEIIVQHYIPTPQRAGMYGAVEGKVEFPASPEEWAEPRWVQFTTRVDPNMPWLPRELKRRIDDFETVLSSRWPTIQDIRMPGWGRGLLRSLSAWRYALGLYAAPLELRWAQHVVNLRKPRMESL